MDKSCPTGGTKRPPEAPHPMMTHLTNWEVYELTTLDKMQKLKMHGYKYVISTVFFYFVPSVYMYSIRVILHNVGHTSFGNAKSISF